LAQTSALTKVSLPSMSVGCGGKGRRSAMTGRVAQAAIATHIFVNINDSPEWKQHGVDPLFCANGRLQSSNAAAQWQR
jgi:hypothetical protein